MSVAVPHVTVLLSTYNGSRWLEPQLQSILAQTDVAIDVKVRDDGSSDDTAALLDDYARRDERVRWYAGDNLGVVASYLRLLGDVQRSAGYVAFSDQDDVWLPGKLRAAVKRLAVHGPDAPAMYCSRVRYVDETLQPLGMSRVPRRIGFANALVENVATGCTVVVNGAMVRLINRRQPTAVLMHDWWCYLVASALGIVEYDSEPHILYRQHGGNVVGGKEGWFATLPHRVRRLRLRGDGVFRCSDQAAEFARCHGAELSADKAELLDAFLAARRGFPAALAMATSGAVRRSHPADDAIVRFLIAARLF